MRGTTILPSSPVGSIARRTSCSVVSTPRMVRTADGSSAISTILRARISWSPLMPNESTNCSDCARTRYRFWRCPRAGPSQSAPTAWSKWSMRPDKNAGCDPQDSGRPSWRDSIVGDEWPFVLQVFEDDRGTDDEGRVDSCLRRTSSNHPCAMRVSGFQSRPHELPSNSILRGCERRWRGGGIQDGISRGSR